MACCVNSFQDGTLRRQLHGPPPGRSLAIRPVASVAQQGESHGEETVVVKITQNDKNNPPGKLADAELHFTEGVLEG